MIVIKDKLKYKGFTGSIKYDEESKIFHGKIEGVRGLYLYEGKSIEELEEDFNIFVDEYIEEKNNHTS